LFMQPMVMFPTQSCREVSIRILLRRERATVFLVLGHPIVQSEWIRTIDDEPCVMNTQGERRIGVFRCAKRTY
jgi:hypothetical protein